MWNTYQCYLKAALSTISSEMEVVQSFGKCFGAKLVRGAYMDKERKLAKMKVRSLEYFCIVFLFVNFIRTMRTRSMIPMRRRGKCTTGWWTS